MQPPHASVLNAMERHARRVKLYDLTTAGENWEDQGTGSVSIENDPCRLSSDCTPDKFRLVVVSEESSEILLNTFLFSNRQYNKQKAMIMWQDGKDDSVYRALSFQNGDCCNYAWAILLGAVPSELLKAKEDGESEFSDESDSGLAEPYIGNVADFAAQLCQVEFEMSKGLVAFEDLNVLLRSFTHEKWLCDLWKVFEDAKSTEDLDTCGHVAEIVTRIVTSYVSAFSPFVFTDALGIENGDPIAILLGPVHCQRFFSAMEYEKELRRHGLMLSHTSFLTQQATFCRVLPEADSTKMEEMATFIYRLLYVRDVCLPRHLDEQAMQRMTVMINICYAQVCRLLLVESDCFVTLKSLLLEESTAASFLLQLLSVLRPQTSHINDRALLLQRMKESEVLEYLEGYLTGDCPAVVKWHQRNEDIRKMQDGGWPTSEWRPNLLARRDNPSNDPLTIAVEILHLSGEIQPGLLREAISRSASRSVDDVPSLWLALADVLASECGEAIMSQVGDIFRLLLNPATMDSPLKDDIISLFYDKRVLSRLTEHLFRPQDADKDIGTFGRQQICDILAFCVKQHHSRMRYKIMTDMLPSRILEMATNPLDKCLCISAIKLVKACLTSTNVESYARQCVKTDIFKYLFAKTLPACCTPSARRGSGSILEGCILDLFGIISSRQLFVIIEYLFGNYSLEISRLDRYYRTSASLVLFQRLKQQYDDHRHIASGLPLSHSAAVQVDIELNKDDDRHRREEAYFTSDDGGGDVRCPTNSDQLLLGDVTLPPMLPLVAYDDDDEDDSSRFIRQPQIARLGSPRKIAVSIRSGVVSDGGGAEDGGGVYDRKKRKVSVDED